MNYLDVNVKVYLHRIHRVSGFISQVKPSFCYLTSRKTWMVLSLLYLGMEETQVMSLMSICCSHQCSNVVDRLVGSPGLESYFCSRAWLNL